jgi:hypothetical protein
MDVVVCKSLPMRLVWSTHKGGNSHNDQILTLQCVFQSGIAHQLHYNLMSCYRKNELPSFDSCHFKERIDTCSYLSLYPLQNSASAAVKWKSWFQEKGGGPLVQSHRRLVLKYLSCFELCQSCRQKTNFVLVKTHMAMLINLISHPTICFMPAHWLMRQIWSSQTTVAQVNIAIQKILSSLFICSRQRRDYIEECWPKRTRTIQDQEVQFAQWTCRKRNEEISLTTTW